MANLERKSYMSISELTVICFETIVGLQIVLTNRSLVAEAEQFSWLSVLVCGFAVSVIVYLIVRLGQYYPEETFIEYIPRLWGRWGSHLLFSWFVAAFVCQLWVILQGFTGVIGLVLLDATPYEVIIGSILIVVAYGALQEWGTILRFVQVIFFVITPFVLLLWYTNLINFHFDNLLPLWPIDFGKVFAGAERSWDLFAGYEILLLLLPQVYPIQGKKVRKAMCGLIVAVTLLYASSLIITLGVLTSEGTKSTTYPTIVIIKAVELPGTFVERLENYLVVNWIPLVLDTMVVFIFTLAQVLARWFRYRDHRPFVLILMPILFAGSSLMENRQSVEAMTSVAHWLGLTFSLVVIPISFVLAWRRHRLESCG